jgi:hypothetical protein
LLLDLACVDRTSSIAPEEREKRRTQSSFTDTEIQDYRDTWRGNSQDFEKFRRGMLESGVFLVPQFNKRCHLSAAHTRDDIDHLTEKTKEILSASNHSCGLKLLSRWNAQDLPSLIRRRYLLPKLFGNSNNLGNQFGVSFRQDAPAQVYVVLHANPNIASQRNA